jgi:hypothetical protein
MECASWSEEESWGEDTVWVRLLACLLQLLTRWSGTRHGSCGGGASESVATLRRLRAFSFPPPIGTKTVEL